MKNWKKTDKNYEKEKEKYPNPVPSRDFILETISSSKDSFSISTLAKLYSLNKAEKETLIHRIKAMLRDLQLQKTDSGKLIIAPKLNIMQGKVIAHPEGYGFFVANDDSDDLYLSNKEMRQVMHGDLIEAVEVPSKRPKKEGKVIKVLEHNNPTIIGRLINEHNIWSVVPENRRINNKVCITNLDTTNAAHNQVVEVKITEYPTKYKPITGEIIRVLGDYMDSGLEIEVAISSHGLPNTWNEDVKRQTISIADELQEDDYKDRVDIRHLPLVTIDGITARDFDDAVYAKKTKAGYVLYVAIADVAHYVEQNSPLDLEAQSRGTSVYFPNRVIPMLPEKLSNGLCSLNPHVDRLCLVCEMQIDNEGNIKRSKFYDAVMHSHARLTYESVEEVLFNDNQVLQNDYSKLIPDLENLKSLYELLRKQRNTRGAIDFRTVEAEFEYDSAGKIERIVAKENLKSNQLIEEFMVRANVCAAKFLLKQKGKGKPIALFRNHEGPSNEKLEKLVAILAKNNIKINAKDTVTPQQIAKVVLQIQGLDNFDYLQTMVLRSMYQAVYSPINEGHFGLALENYAHFTSPIRRYPDLLVHRAIKYANKYKGELYTYSEQQMTELAEHCSMTERRADDASYDVAGFLKCEYMRDKVGQEFMATISAVTSFGFFATLDGEFVDGLVHISTLDGDYFNFDEDNVVLVGERTKIIYSVGDSIKVIVSKVNMDERKIDFSLTDEYLPKSKKSTKKKTNKSKKRRSRKGKKSF